MQNKLTFNVELISAVPTNFTFSTQNQTLKMWNINDSNQTIKIKLQLLNQTLKMWNINNVLGFDLFINHVFYCSQHFQSNTLRSSFGRSLICSLQKCCTKTQRRSVEHRKVRHATFYYERKRDKGNTKGKIRQCLRVLINVLNIYSLNNLNSFLPLG
jgi:hypothetical protein